MKFCEFKKENRDIPSHWETATTDEEKVRRRLKGNKTVIYLFVGGSQIILHVSRELTRSQATVYLQSRHLDHFIRCIYTEWSRIRIPPKTALLVTWCKHSCGSGRGGGQKKMAAIRGALYFMFLAPFPPLTILDPMLKHQTENNRTHCQVMSFSLSQSFSVNSPSQDLYYSCDYLKLFACMSVPEFESQQPLLCKSMWGQDRLCASRQEVGKCSTRGGSRGTYITFASAMRISSPLWLWNPEETSPEIQNRGTSGPKKGHVSAKNFKKKKKLFACMV